MYGVHSALVMTMGDFSDFGLDPGIIIKSEPMNNDSNNTMITSASVPIPFRRDPPPDYLYDDNSQSSLYGTIGLTHNQILSPPNTYDTPTSFWGTRLINNEDNLKSEALIHMDEDDIFQVDKADLLQGPTLAELNANDENFLGDLNFDDLLLPNEISYTNLDRSAGFFVHNNTSNHFGNNNQLTGIANSAPQASMLYRDLEPLSSLNTTPSFLDYNSRTPISALSPGSPASSSSSVANSQTSPLHKQGAQQNKHSTLHDLLMKREKYISPERQMLGQSVPCRELTLTSPTVLKYRNHASRLSSSAPTHLGLDQIWQRREPRKHLLSTSSLAEAGSTSSLSTGGILSPDPPDFSDQDGSDDDSDGHYEDYSSGNDSDDDDEATRSQKAASKKEKYFWQYNIQAKGPKGQRLVMKSKMEDPHVLQEITDPVFSPDCSVRGIKHSGKARKGDGNDLTPNPRKLYTIGKELDKLSRVINDMTPVSELPFNVRPTSRKEKNKLASRACRLKKKAQHEANKIKLSGLEQEHKRYINSIIQLKQLITAKLTDPNMDQRDEVNLHVDKLFKNCTKTKVAGHTTDYVNKVLDKIKVGGPPLSASFTEDL